MILLSKQKMISIGNTKKLVISGWVLATILVISYNGFQLTLLFSPPVIGYSEIVKWVISKRDAYETQIAKTISDRKPFDPIQLTANIDRLPNKQEELPAPSLPSPVSSAETKMDADNTETEMVFPQLQGVLCISDIHGKARLRAVLEGKTMKEQDVIGNFTIERITDKGVLLKKDKQSWFLGLPDNPFSLAREE